ncbi:phage major capsid protein [Acinetobacter sp. ANC 4945]|uniref:Major capsid protein n=1 Tax=Acinetobacter amyesii TaxID=2942470 RepID=A0A1T1H6M0_9GAMM|nr:phage major capsid protein [Acinetobacter amyesii]MCL6246513.1 phage major capsid protein [Acinetobacter amyesii]OOV85521.1 major capsid protein [Acinetobacter amyesii]
MKLAEQIKKLKENIGLKQNEIVEKSGKHISKGLTPDEATEAEITQLQAEIDVMDTNLKRLEGIETNQKAWGDDSTPIEGDTSKKGLDSTQGKKPVIETSSNIPKGIGFALMVKAMAVASSSNGSISADAVLKNWGAPESVCKAVTQKALIGSTSEPTFGASLVELQHYTGEFIELLRGKTAVDKLAAKMRQVPFNIKVPSQTGAASVGWVGEKKRKPTTNPTFGSLTLTKSKVAGIVLLSDELVRFSNPKADGLVLDDLLKSTATFIDGQFFDPTKDESDDSPASILNGLDAVPSSGVTGAAIEADLALVMKQITDAGLSLEGATWVMSETRAAQLSMLRDALGKKYFEGMNINGTKELVTLPVEISAACTDKIALVLPGQILLADDDSMDFAISTEATINMGTDAAPNWVNLYENNLMAIRAERFIRWKPRGKAAGYIQF